MVLSLDKLVLPAPPSTCQTEALFHDEESAADTQRLKVNRTLILCIQRRGRFVKFRGRYAFIKNVYLFINFQGNVQKIKIS